MSRASVAPSLAWGSLVHLGRARALPVLPGVARVGLTRAARAPHALALLVGSRRAHPQRLSAALCPVVFATSDCTGAAPRAVPRAHAEGALMAAHAACGKRALGVRAAGPGPHAASCSACGETLRRCLFSFLLLTALEAGAASPAGGAGAKGTSRLRRPRSSSVSRVLESAQASFKERDLRCWCALAVQGLARPGPPTPEALRTLSLAPVGPWRSWSPGPWSGVTGRGADQSVWGCRQQAPSLTSPDGPGQDMRRAGPFLAPVWLTQMRPCEQGGPRSACRRLSCSGSPSTPVSPLVTFSASGRAGGLRDGSAWSGEWPWVARVPSLSHCMPRLHYFPVACHSLQDTTALAGRRGLSAPAGCGGWQVLSRGQCVSSVEACAGPWPTSCVRLSAPASVWGRVGGGLVTARRDWGLAMPLARRRPGSEGASGAACSAVLCVREVFLSVLRLHLCSPGFR